MKSNINRDGVGNMKEDYVIRATAEGAYLRAFVARTTKLCEEARKRHDTYPTATAALGRLLTAAGMLGMTLKGDDILTIRLQGNGPLGQLVGVSRCDGLIKGYVAEPHVHLPLRPDGKLDVGGAVGEGMLYITKDLGLKEPYTGSTPLVTGEIAEDLTSYFAISEQTPSAVALGVLVDVDNSVKGAGGFLVQLMPAAPEELVNKLEDNLGKIGSISRQFADGLTPEGLLQQIFAGFSYQSLGSQSLHFACDCSRSKLEQILISLGEEEMASLLKDEGGAEVRCHYCNERHQFVAEDLNRLIREIKEKA